MHINIMLGIRCAAQMRARDQVIGDFLELESGGFLELEAGGFLELE